MHKRVSFLILILFFISSCDINDNHLVKCWTSDSQVIFINLKYKIIIDEKENISDTIIEIERDIVKAELSSILKDICHELPLEVILKDINTLKYRRNVISQIEDKFSAEIKIKNLKMSIDTQ